jgi:hypothetical protein
MSFGVIGSQFLIELEDAATDDQRNIWVTELRRLTGQDFGYDIHRWAEWLENHPPLPDLRSEAEAYADHKEFLNLLRQHYGYVI